MEPNSSTDILVDLRRRLLDLQKTLTLSPESFGLYEQTILQLHQETERRRQYCFAQAQSLRQQAVGLESQAHAFSAMASILYAVVNGYIQLEEKRVREDQEREKERIAASAPEQTVVAALKRKGRRKEGPETSGGDSGNSVD